MKRCLLILLALTLNAPGAEISKTKTLEGLNRAYVDPGLAKNAAPRFEAAAKRLQITEADKQSLRLPFIGKAKLSADNEPISADSIAAINDWVKRNEPVYKDFQEASLLTESRYPLDLTQGFEMPLPHLGVVRAAENGLALFALQRAVNRKPAEAGEALQLCFAAAQTLEQEPLLVSQLVRGAMLVAAVNAMEQVFNRVSLPFDSLEPLRQRAMRAERDLSSGAAFDRVVALERANLLAVLNAPAPKLADALEMIAPGDRDFAAKVRKSLKGERANLDNVFDRVEAARRFPLPERMKQLDLIPDPGRGSAYPFAQRTLPALIKNSVKEARMTATVRLALIAIALEEYRAEHHRYPDAQTALVPKYLAEVLKDPFTGDAISFRRMGSGYSMKCAGSGDADHPPKLDFTVFAPPAL